MPTSALIFCPVFSLLGHSNLSISQSLCKSVCLPCGGGKKRVNMRLCTIPLRCYFEPEDPTRASSLADLSLSLTHSHPFQNSWQCAIRAPAKIVSHWLAGWLRRRPRGHRSQSTSEEEGRKRHRKLSSSASVSLSHNRGKLPRLSQANGHFATVRPISFIRKFKCWWMSFWLTGAAADSISSFTNHAIRRPVVGCDGVGDDDDAVVDC